MAHLSALIERVEDALGIAEAAVVQMYAQATVMTAAYVALPPVLFRVGLGIVAGDVSNDTLAALMERLRLLDVRLTALQAGRPVTT